MPDARRSPLADHRALVVVLLVAAALRVWLLRTRVTVLDADEAVTGTMARRILDGDHHAFFAGQDYMGTLEQYLQAGALAVLPESPLTLRLPLVALALVACVLVHRLALRCGLSTRRALLAAAMFAVGPYFPVLWSVKSRGAYAVAMVIGLAALVLVLGPLHRDRWRLATAASFGLLAGLGFWANQQTAYLLVPAAWWLAGSTRGRWPSTLAAMLPAALLGASPALWHVADSGAPLFGGTKGDSAISERAAHFFTGTVPDLIGVRDDAEPLVSWLPPAFLSTVALAALAAAVVARRRGLAGFVLLRPGQRSPIDLLLAVLLLAPGLYVLSGTATTSTSRFVYVLHGVLPVLLAAVPLPRALRVGARPVGLAVLALLLLAAHTWVGAERLISQGDGAHRADRQEVFVDELGPVVGALVAAGEATAYADYWLAHPLNWEAGGAVLVESAHTRRFPHITDAIAADPSPALVVGDREIDDVRDALDDRGATYDVALVEGWWVVTGVEPGVHLPPAATVADGIRAVA